MTLPKSNRAVVPRAKIVEYLLSFAHPDGRSKAEFFAQYGFDLDNWQVLQAALQQHGHSNPVVSEARSLYGVRYVVEGPLMTPDRRNPLVCTVWIVEVRAAAPRLITAYPVRRQHAQRT